MKLYLIRHGISCANLLRAQQQTLAANQYVDPELTEEGRAQAIRLGPALKRKLKRPYVVGASVMLRAQQTAYHLLHPSKLYIVPHIRELWRTSLECTALSKQDQERVLREQTGDGAIPPIRDYSYSEPDVPEPQQITEFLKWLGSKGQRLTKGTKNLVLVSHGGFIEHFIKQVLDQEVSGIVNYELFEFDYTVRKKRAIIKSFRGIPYIDRNRLYLSTRKNASRCRLQNRTHRKGL